MSAFGVCPLQEDVLANQKWALKRLIERLESAKGIGSTSLISVYIRPNGQLSKVVKKLTEEQGVAANIKKTATRQSVSAALASLLERIKLYNNKVPQNGLVMFCGICSTKDGSGKGERRERVDFEPFAPLGSCTQYWCGDSFLTQPLRELLNEDVKYGVVVVDGRGCLMAVLHGHKRQVLSQISVHLANKHNKGGQSSNRFERLRDEQRDQYLGRVAEVMNNVYTTDQSRQPTCKGLVLAGPAQLKTDLAKSGLLLPQLQEQVLHICDVAYGGLNGLNQAIGLCAPVLKDCRLVQEKMELQNFFDLVSKDEPVCVGVTESLFALQAGAVIHLICDENLTTKRISSLDGEPKILNPKQNGQQLTMHEQDQELLEWLMEPDCSGQARYLSFGCTLKLVATETSEGEQFLKGFGGIAGVLRYQVNFPEEEKELGLDEEY